MKQSKNLNFENVFGKDEVNDGCRKMFSGFNILDNKNSNDVFAEIQRSSLKATRQLSSSPSLDKSEPTASPISNSHSKLQSKLNNVDSNIENNVTVSNGEDIELLNAIFAYARENVALVNIYIKPPVVTRILRDQRTPIIWYVLSYHFCNKIVCILFPNFKELRNSSFKILFLGSWLIVEAYLVSVWGSPLSPYLKFCITFLNPCVGNLEIVFRVPNCLLVVKNKNQWVNH